MFVDERFERHEIESRHPVTRAVGWHHHMRCARAGAAIVDGTRMCVHVGPRPIAHRLPQRIDRLVDSCCRTKVNTSGRRHSSARHTRRNEAAHRRRVDLDRGSNGRKIGKLQQRRILGQCRLHPFERHGLNPRAQLAAVRAEFHLEPLLLRLQLADRSADARQRNHHLPHSTRPAPAARWCCSTDPGGYGLGCRPPCAARPRTHRSSHRARVPSAAARRGRPARRLPHRRARHGDAMKAFCRCALRCCWRRPASAARSRPPG